MSGRDTGVVVAPKKIDAPPPTGTAQTWIASIPLSADVPFRRDHPPTRNEAGTVAPGPGVSIAIRGCGDGPATYVPPANETSYAMRPTTSAPVAPSHTRTCGP